MRLLKDNRKSMSRKNKICWLLILGLSLFPSVILSQQPTVQMVVDKNSILIGEQFKYVVKAIFPAQYRVAWMNVPDSIYHFEVTGRSKIDSSAENNKNVLQQTITFTSFDSGIWKTPAFLISFENVTEKKTIRLYTDSVAINVGYSPPDSTNQLRDIKPIREVSVMDYTWYYIVGGILLLLLASTLVWWYFKKRKKKVKEVFASSLSPYEEAMRSLEKLSQLNLQNPEEIKQYHSHLAVTLKRFISRKQHQDHMNKTSGDVLILLTVVELPKENKSDLAAALRCGDAVKFAKYLPAPPESEGCLTKIKSSIYIIQNSIPNTKS